MPLALGSYDFKTSDYAVLSVSCPASEPTLESVPPNPAAYAVPALEPFKYHYLSDYMSILDPKRLEEKIACSLALLRIHDVKFDAIAVRGCSGTLFGGALAFLTKVPLILVRKPGARVTSAGKPYEYSHSRYEIEGYRNSTQYLLVDDFVCSGGTLAAIVNAVTVWTHGRARPVGALLYGLDQAPTFYWREKLKHMGLHLRGLRELQFPHIDDFYTVS